MIVINIHCVNVERWVFFCDGVEMSYEDVLDVGFEEFSSIFGSPNNVILVLVCTVVEALNSHAVIVARLPSCSVNGTIHPRTRQKGCRGFAAAVSSYGVSWK